MDMGKAKPFSEGQHRGWVGWGRGGALAPPVYILKKALLETPNVFEFVTETFCFPRNI